MEKVEKISAGSYDLNKWLYGGYETDVITMIAGSPGSGKTNFVMLAACSQAKKGNKVIFVDTEGGFSVDRVRQLAGENADKILENIFVLKPVSFKEQIGVFEKLKDTLKKEHASLVVIDGIAMLYRLELGDAVQSGEFSNVKLVNKEVAKQMKFLAEIARRQNIPVLLTNQVYSDFVCEEDWKKGIKGNTNIVGGDLTKYWCKCIIELKKEGHKRKACLLKHRSLAESEFAFEIKDEGIFKRGWL